MRRQAFVFRFFRFAFCFFFSLFAFRLSAFGFCFWSFASCLLLGRQKPKAKGPTRPAEIILAGRLQAGCLALVLANRTRRLASSASQAEPTRANESRPEPSRLIRRRPESASRKRAALFIGAARRRQDRCVSAAAALNGQLVFTRLDIAAPAVKANAKCPTRIA